MAAHDPIVSSIQNVLEKFPEILIATLFGSAAQGRMTDTSDIDIAIACRQRLSCEEKMSLAAELETASQRSIDLVDLQQVSVPSCSRLCALAGLS
ncbi:MAG: nucleotidyltransferase domain-containing protein [Desulfoplanes sp.]|nr:nucleotidyltransferase domain-containing protein [Desulfoplanes sp.]MDD4650120.1 nucleotidyltransferase domain-containing protein [Desulfoplanes sp.]